MDLQISRIELPKPVIKRTFDFLRQHGQEQNEAFAIWVGRTKRMTFEITDAWFPLQENTPISYEVPADEIHRMNVKMNSMRLLAIAQVHSHPGGAFHSHTDDENASLQLPGSFSIVIPDFGFVKRDHDTDLWAVFRYTGKDWLRVSKRTVKETFRIE
jgi:hypothetical protein